MSRQHIESIQIVAQGLGDLVEEVVFVGGAVAEFYATSPAAEEPRISEDIDCVIEIGSRKEYSALENLLELRGFKHDTTGGPVCRWIYKHILVDIMPTNEEILGFNNKWYLEGIKSKTANPLPDGNVIYIFPPELYLASKLEAFNSRGKNDLRQSTDFEDIIYILENNIDIAASLSSSSTEVKKYLEEQFKILIERDDIVEGIECALPYGSESESVKKILDLFQLE